MCQILEELLCPLKMLSLGKRKYVARLRIILLLFSYLEGEISWAGEKHFKDADCCECFQKERSTTEAEIAARNWSSLELPNGNLSTYLRDKKWNNKDVRFYLNERIARYNFFILLAIYSFACCFIFTLVTFLLHDER